MSDATYSPSAQAGSSKAERARPTVAAWLFISAFMVAAMIVIGGITRLTESGLSMVEWRPLMGWIPPMSDAEWQRVFDMYKTTPEYTAANFWMTIDDFKTIFFWEYVHRVWGRLIGLVFAVPFLVFLVTGRIERSLVPRLVLLFVLGGIQGGIGWWMVTSGLVDEARVSPYRLSVHLSMAFLILGLLLWTALGLVQKPAGGTRSQRIGAGHVLAAVSITVLLGAFVAGTDAGYAYNTFPLMGGQFVPAEYWDPDLGWRSLVEHVPAVQFHHRWVAILTALLTLVFVLRNRARTEGAAQLALTLLGAMVLVQVGLGIAALLAVVPVWLGALHQAGAVALFSLAVWTRFALRTP
ncbi:COX15/CtaA family protein [Thalassobaculum sp.]|uniref:COX15/CtaA family protein n=1 Tax=Thalassobaculum sp. TaxID=2022740 RepID=UPI003B58CCEC